MPDIVIEPARPEELPEAALLLSHAMISNPETAAVFRGRRDRLERVFRIILKRLPGEVFVAKDAGRIVGVMRMVEWPHCVEAPFFKRMTLLPLMIWAMKDTFSRGMEFQSTWAGRDPRKPHWHLGPVGVLPERQGQGIGSELLGHFCNHLDGLGAAGYLETGTRDNVRFYERFGFSETGQIPVLDVPTWLMWRAASQ